MSSKTSTHSKKIVTMRRSFLLLISGMLLAIAPSLAQQRFITTGVIEFEKKVNMHKLIEDNAWTREMKDQMPVYRTTYFNLLFDSTQSVYKSGREAAEDKWKNFWGSEESGDNVVHQHFASGTSTMLKQVFEKKYLIQDSAIQIEWRITDETRTIAGFDCRKAVGKLFDSLYVVAFYTDQIVAPTGPEQYTGLPGTILGLGFPRFYTTIFATKVELRAPTPAELAAPAKGGQRIKRRELMAQIKSVFKWGSEEERQKGFWSVIL